MTKEKLSVCLLNDSFPPVIDGVANAVLNYARIIQEGLGSTVVGVPDYPGVTDSYPFPVVRYPSFDTTKLVGYRAGYPFSPRALDALAEFAPDIHPLSLPGDVHRNGQSSEGAAGYPGGIHLSYQI